MKHTCSKCGHEDIIYELTLEKFKNPCYDLINESEGIGECDASEECTHKDAGGKWDNCSSGKLSNYYPYLLQGKP